MEEITGKNKCRKETAGTTAYELEKSMGNTGQTCGKRSEEKAKVVINVYLWMTVKI